MCSSQSLRGILYALLSIQMCSAQADNSGDNLVKRALKAMPFDLADLDKTTQGKASAQTTAAQMTQAKASAQNEVNPTFQKIQDDTDPAMIMNPAYQKIQDDDEDPGMKINPSYQKIQHDDDDDKAHDFSLESRAAIILEAVAACMGLLFVWWKAMIKLANSGTVSTDLEPGLKENLLAAPQEQIDRLIAQSKQSDEQLKTKELLKQVKEPVSADRKQKEEQKKSLNDLAAWISKDQPKKPTEEWSTCGPGKDQAKPGVDKETPKEYTAKEIIQIGKALNDPKAVIKPMVGGTSPRSPRSPQASGYGQVAQPFKQVIAQSVKQTSVGTTAAPGSLSPRLVSSPTGIASFPQTQPVVVRTMRRG